MRLKEALTLSGEEHMAYQDNCVQNSGGGISRRTLVGAVAAGAGAIALGGPDAIAQTGPVAPPSTITSPPRDFGPNAPPNVYFTDPDVLTVDPSFDGLRQPNAPIQRLWTGALWSEGPAWNAQGRYLVWSDIPNNRQKTTAT
jgi:gluconolactonase